MDLQAILDSHRGHLGVERDAFHYQIYKWWKNQYKQLYKSNKGYYPSFGRENFCHYCRAVAIYAPFFWFWIVPFWKWVRPWMALFSLAALSGIALATTLFTNIVVEVVLKLCVVALLGGAFVGLIFGCVWLDENYHYEIADGWEAFWGVAGIPFRIIGKVLAFIFGPVLDVIFKFFDWFLCHKIFGSFVAPWMVALGSVYIASLVIFSGYAVKILIWTAVATIFVLAICKFVIWMDEGNPEVVMETLEETWEKVTESRPWSTLELVLAFFAAKKAKVCPFVDLPEEDEATEESSCVYA